MNNIFYRYRSLFIYLALALMIYAISACKSPTVQGTITPTNTEAIPTKTAPHRTPSGEATATISWKTYQNAEYGFQLSFPDQGLVMEGAGERSARIDLPFTSGTNLQEKYVQVEVQENPVECSSPLAQGYAPNTLQEGAVTINGIDFHTTSGEEGAAGNIYQWTAYSTSKDSTCVSVSFILHATNPDNYPTPPPEYDKASESAIFTEIISTFKWTN